jgi:hypothetical protein
MILSGIADCVTDIATDSLSNQVEIEATKNCVPVYPDPVDAQPPCAKEGLTIAVAVANAPTSIIPATLKFFSIAISILCVVKDVPLARRQCTLTSKERLDRE